MGTPLRRSRRLGGPKAEAPESPTARRALAEFELDLEETREPASPRPPGLGSPRREPASGPESPRREPEPSGGPPQALGGRGEPGARWAPRAEELARRPLQHQPSGPGSPEPHPGQQAPGPEPSPPPQERTPPPPGSPRGQRLPGQPPPARELAGDGLRPKGRKGPSAQAPAPKKLKEEAEVPLIPKGKPKSGRVWKDRAKKR